MDKYGPNLSAVMRGEGGPDDLTGGDSAASGFQERFFGFGGADVIDGGAGADRLDGGSGSDSLYGGAGADVILGGIGSDSMYGGTGVSTICGGGDLSGSGDYFEASVAGAHQFWAPWASGATAPSGVTTGGATLCGDVAWGSSWVAGVCSYTLTAEPSAC